MTIDKRARLHEIAEIAVQNSGKRLHLAFNVADDSNKRSQDAAHFLKLDGVRIGRDIETYGFMGDLVVGWEQTLPMFLGEVIFPLKNVLPESYNKAGEALRALGETVYQESELQEWRELF